MALKSVTLNTYIVNRQYPASLSAYTSETCTFPSKMRYVANIKKSASFYNSNSVIKLLPSYKQINNLKMTQRNKKSNESWIDQQYTCESFLHDRHQTVISATNKNFTCINQCYVCLFFIQ